jgi:hypothetical protein
MSAPEQENNWENDPVWDLVDQSQAPGASPLFVRNVMREVRLAKETRLPWWKPLLAPRPILAGSLAAMTVALLIAIGPQSQDQVTAANPSPDELSEPEMPQLDALLEEEMLSQAAEDPAAFSDEALVALLSQ